MASREPLLGLALSLSPPTDDEAPAAAKAPADASVITNEFQVDKVNGFWENSYRLVFPFEDKVKWPGEEEKFCLTCLNTGNGVIENTDLLKAEKTRGLIAFAYAQSVDEAQRGSFPSLLEKKCEKEIKKGELSHQIDPRNLNNFMWDRPDGTIALVHTWKTKYNEEFQKRFKIMDQNPSEHLFEPQAVYEFERAMKNIFGQDVLDKVQVKFCWSSIFNQYPVYIAPARELVNMLKGREAVREELNIHKVEENGFVSNVVNKKGGTSIKEFILEMDATYALYVKDGFDKMACATPIGLFLRERVLNRPGHDKEKIPSNLLPISLPDWIIDKEVAKLFFSDSKLVQGTRQIPQPIPINSCVGPGLWWAWARAMLLWTQVILTTWGFFFFNIRLVWVWPFFLLVVLFGLGAETICVKHFIVPWVQQAQGCVTPVLSLVCPDTGRLFKVWMPLSMAASILSMMSIQLNALFVVRTWERQWSDSTQGEQEIAFWNEVMNKSTFGTLLDWHFWTPHLAALVLWLISVSQLLVPLVNIVRSPTDKGQRDLTVKYVEKKPVEWQGLFHFVRFRGRKRPITPFEALTDMGYAGGMTTVGCTTFSYPLAQIREALKLKKQGWELEALTYLTLAQKAAVIRLFLDFLLKKCLQLKIQVSIYAIHRSMLLQCNPSSNPILYEALAPIIVTLFTGLFTQIDLVLTIFKANKKVHAELKTNEESRMICRSNLNTAIILAIAIFGAGFSGYSVLQLLMIRTCESSLWNWTGCVEERDVRAYTSITCAQK